MSHLSQALGRPALGRRTAQSERRSSHVVRQGPGLPLRTRRAMFAAMTPSLRVVLRALASVGLVAVSSAAVARDYIVVGSTEPAIVRGQSFEAGARLSLPPGRTLTLMHASGSLVTVKGAAAGVVLPRRQGNQAEADRLAIMRSIVAPPPSRATRGGICPGPETLTTLDAIAQAQQAGCRIAASRALDAWIAAQAPEEIEAPQN